MKPILAAGAVLLSLSFAVDADAFGGRGYARRHARRAHHVPVYRAPVVVRSVPVVGLTPVRSYYRAPVSIGIGTGVYPGYGGYGRYGGFNNYRGYGYPGYGGGGISIGIGR